MPEQAVVALNGKSLFFWLDMLLFWDKLRICLPVIGAHYCDGFIFHIFPELFSCCAASCADFTVDKSFLVSTRAAIHIHAYFFLSRCSCAFHPSLLHQWNLHCVVVRTSCKISVSSYTHSRGLLLKDALWNEILILQDIIQVPLLWPRLLCQAALP